MIPVSETTSSDHYVWDLAPLYSSQAQWEGERDLILRKLESIHELRGKVALDAGSLAQALDYVADIRTRSARMAEYGIFMSMLDTKSSVAQHQYDVGISLETQVEGAVSFVEDEVRNIGQERLTQFVRDEPLLDPHLRRLHLVMREIPHIGSPDAQLVIRSLNRWPLVSWDTYWALCESDLGWPVITAPSGEPFPANRSAYMRFRGSRDSTLRSAVTSGFLTRLKLLEGPFGTLLTRRIEANIVIAQKQKFRDGIEHQLFREGLPGQAARTMVEASRNRLATLHRYLEIRRRALGLRNLTYAEVYLDPPGSERRFSVSETYCDIVEAAAPLGSEYQSKMRGLLATPWAHLPPLPQKRDEYGIWYPVGGKGPYGFMKYDGTFTSSNLLAGLAFLLVTYASIPADHPTDTRNDPGIYSNAILYAGMLLHADYLQRHAGDPQTGVAYLLTIIDRLAQTLFRHPLTVEFEGQIQELMLASHPPSGSEVSKIYLELLRKYFQSADDPMIVDDVFETEWITGRLSFASFETVNWPLAMAAACTIVGNARTARASGVKAFTGVLGRGNSDLSYDLLKEAGVDLARPEPYDVAIQLMNDLIDQVERLLETGN